jgi:hypothetical protein
MLKCADDLTMSRFAASSDSISVVQFCGPIQAESYAEMLRCKKSAPILVKQDSVGLNPVENLFVPWLMLALKRDNFAKIIQSCQSGLASMPGEGNRRSRRSVNMLDNVFFEQRIGHAERFNTCSGLVLADVVAIPAFEIAESTHGFGENLKIMRYFSHFRP